MLLYLQLCPEQVSKRRRDDMNRRNWDVIFFSSPSPFNLFSSLLLNLQAFLSSFLPSFLFLLFKLFFLPRSLKLMMERIELSRKIKWGANFGCNFDPERWASVFLLSQENSRGRTTFSLKENRERKWGEKLDRGENRERVEREWKRGWIWAAALRL